MNTYGRFPRASRDNVLRSPEVLSGPHYRPGRIRDGLYWAGAVCMLISLFYAPDIYSWLVR